MLPDVAEDVPHLPRLDAFGPVVVAVFPFPRALPVAKPVHQGLEVLDRVPDVEYLDREGEVAVVDGVQPFAPVGYVEDGLRHPPEAPVEFGAEVLAELFAPVRRGHVRRRAEVAVRLVVLRLRRDEDGPGLDLPGLRPPVLALGAFQAFPPHRHPRPVRHDADGRGARVRAGGGAGFAFPGESRGLGPVKAHDLAYRVRGDPERVVAREAVGGVPVRVADGVPDHFVRGGGRVSSGQPEPVVERIVAFAAALVPVVGAPDLREFSEEGDDPLAVAARVALPGFRQVVLRARGARGEKLGHELAAEAVHVVEERLLEAARASDAVALDRRGGGVYDGVDPRGASQNEVRELFFRGDWQERIASASAFVSSTRSFFAVAPPFTASTKAGSLSLGILMVWFRPSAQYWRLW